MSCHGTENFSFTNIGWNNLFQIYIYVDHNNVFKPIFSQIYVNILLHIYIRY